MKKVNWKGNLIALGITAGVLGTSFIVNYNKDNSIDADYTTAKVSQTNIIAADNSNDITDDDSSPFVDTSYMQDKPEIKVGSPFQDVLEALGQPDNKVVTRGKYGSSELWTYGNKDIFFIDGFVDSITEVK